MRREYIVNLQVSLNGTSGNRKLGIPFQTGHLTNNTVINQHQSTIRFGVYPIFEEALAIYRSASPFFSRHFSSVTAATAHLGWLSVQGRTAAVPRGYAWNWMDMVWNDMVWYVHLISSNVHPSGSVGALWLGILCAMAASRFSWFLKVFLRWIEIDVNLDSSFYMAMAQRLKHVVPMDLQD